MTEDTPFLSKTEHILYIYSNARYCCSKGDGKEFERTIPLINVYPSTTLLGESYTADYIAGRYPEFDGALQAFAKQVKKRVQKVHTLREKEGLASNTLFFSDEELAAMSSAIIKKFNLRDKYDFSSPLTPEQLERINHRILPKQKRELKKVFKPALSHIGIAFAEKCKDFRLVYKFMVSTHRTTQSIALGKVDKKTAKEYMQVKGVPLGLDLLELREVGILDKKLNITDMEAFMRTKVMTEFKFEDKTYNLTDKETDSDNLVFKLKQNSGIKR